MRIPVTAGIALLLLSGCGGGSSGPAPTVLTLTSSTTLDGWISTEPVVAPGDDIRAGDYFTFAQRGFITFDLPVELQGKQIESAVLTVNQSLVFGTPYSSLGSLVLDHLDYGASLELADYSVSALDSGFAVLSLDPATGQRSVGVAQQLEADLQAGRTRSQFRVRFTIENDGDGGGDEVHFQSAANFPGHGPVPQLVVAYLP